MELSSSLKGEQDSKLRTGQMSDSVYEEMKFYDDQQLVSVGTHECAEPILCVDRGRCGFYNSLTEDECVCSSERKNVVKK